MTKSCEKNGIGQEDRFDNEGKKLWKKESGNLRKKCDVRKIELEMRRRKTNKVERRQQLEKYVD